MILPLLGPLLGAGTSLIGAMMGQQAQGAANNINWASLMETKRANRASEALARSDRQDAYGNNVRYVPGLGFRYDLTDITKKILSAEQGERYKNLMEDAPRNRAANVRKDERSKLGDEEFEKAFNAYRFRPKRDEAATIADSTNELLSSRRKGLDQAAALLSRQLIRQGRGGDLASVFKMADDSYAGSLTEALLKGKQLGKDRYDQDVESDMRQGQADVGFYKGIANDTDASPVSFSNFDNTLRGDRDGAIQSLMQAIQSGRDASAAGSAQYARGVANSGLDLSGLARTLGSLNFGDQLAEEEEEAAGNDPWGGGLRHVGATYNGL